MSVYETTKWWETVISWFLPTYERYEDGVYIYYSIFRDRIIVKDIVVREPKD